MTSWTRRALLCVALVFAPTVGVNCAGRVAAPSEADVNSASRVVGASDLPAAPAHELQVADAKSGGIISWGHIAQLASVRIEHSVPKQVANKRVMSSAASALGRIIVALGQEAEDWYEIGDGLRIKGVDVWVSSASDQERSVHLALRVMPTEEMPLARSEGKSGTDQQTSDAKHAYVITIRIPEDAERSDDLEQLVRNGCVYLSACEKHEGLLLAFTKEQRCWPVAGESFSEAVVRAIGERRKRDQSQ